HLSGFAGGMVGGGVRALDGSDGVDELYAGGDDRFVHHVLRFRGEISGGAGAAEFGDDSVFTCGGGGSVVAGGLASADAFESCGDPVGGGVPLGREAAAAYTGALVDGAGGIGGGRCSGDRVDRMAAGGSDVERIG